MQFPQANQRRRRVLADDLSAADGVAPRAAVPPPSRSHRRNDGYAPAAKLEQQRRIIDFVPGSHLAFGLWFAAGVSVIGLLAAGHIWLPAIASRLSAQAARSLELRASGSLSSWVAALWLGMAGAMSALIYSIRRHKLDDYRGRYRWWLFGAVAWFVMSVDATCGIHQLFAATMVRMTSYMGAGGGAGWWLMCWGALLCGLSVRLAWEMRVCRPAMTAYLAAIGLWICGVAIQTTDIRLGAAGNVLPSEVTKLLGHLSLLLGLSIYARHVILHAQGLLPSRKRRGRKEKPASATGSKSKTDLQPHVAPAIAPEQAQANSDADEPAGLRTRRDPPAATPPAAHFAASLEVKSKQSSDDRSDDPDLDANAEPDGETDDNSDQDRKLSKAERKRLRKQKARDEQGW